MKQEFLAHFLAIFLALSVHHAAYAQLAQNDHADRVSDATYKELNGIERDQHREIRQTQGTKPATTPFHQLIAKYDLTPRSYDCPVYFGQPTVRPGFSQAGIFRSAAIDEVVGRLQSGSLTPDDVPIQFIWVDGNRVTVNNRSLTALYKAGMRPTKLFDRTDSLPPKGVDTLEGVLLRLEGMGGKPSTEMLVRAAGFGRDGRFKNASDWDAPIREIVSMPGELLVLARTCKQEANRQNLSHARGQVGGSERTQ